MVELGRQATDELRGAIDQALRSGIKAEAIADMVAERTIYHEVATPSDIAELLDHHQDETAPEPEGAVIYDDVFYEPGQLPDGLIDLPSASKKYGIPVKTLRSWVHRGKLPRRGRLRARSPGGGYIVTAKADIEYCRDNPRKTGRKKLATS